MFCLASFLQECRTYAVVDYADQRGGGHVFGSTVPGGDRLPEEIQPSFAARIQHQTVPGTKSDSQTAAPTHLDHFIWKC